MRGINFRLDLVMSLIAQITEILQSKGHPNPAAWTNDNIIINIGEADGKIERLWVNRYWRQWLSDLPEDTMSFRLLLNDDNSDQEYLYYFSEIVAPFIVKYSTQGSK